MQLMLVRSALQQMPGALSSEYGLQLLFQASSWGNEAVRCAGMLLT